MAVAADDPYRADRTWSAGAGPLLEAFEAAGVLGPAEVHTAVRLATLGAEADPTVLLAAALAVRAPRMGHVAADLTTVADVVADDADDLPVDDLPWPAHGPWRAAVAASPLVTEGDGAGDTPLRLIGTSVLLDRYWRDERAVADDLRRRAATPAPALDPAAVEAALGGLFGPGADPHQRSAAALAAGRLLTVVAGGPGTGKTTTVARLLALLHHLADAAGRRPPLVALAAPTGKAAARLQEAVRTEAAGLPGDPLAAERIGALTGTTLHRLLGMRRGSERPRFHRGHRLAADVVVVDEASMVSLGMMTRLVDAVRPDARLVLVGDPQQLVSVEAGAVLADIVAAADAPALEGVVGHLRTNHRAAGALAALADAIRAGDAAAALDLLRSGDEALRWVDAEPPDASAALPDDVAAWAVALVDAARRSAAAEALALLASHRVLCAHRRGPTGVRAVNQAIEAAVGAARPDVTAEGPWYAGRPVLVTANDYALHLFNGDAGVALRRATGGAEVVLDGGGSHPGDAPRTVGAGRLASVETVFAMTVHKSQGSEFDEVTLIAPKAGSRLATRELLYTAVTRARRRLTVVGDAEALAGAIDRPIARASGLTARLR